MSNRIFATAPANVPMALLHAYHGCVWEATPEGYALLEVSEPAPPPLPLTDQEHAYAVRGAVVQLHGAIRRALDDGLEVEAWGTGDFIHWSPTTEIGTGITRRY